MNLSGRLRIIREFDRRNASRETGFRETAFEGPIRDGESFSRLEVEDSFKKTGNLTLRRKLSVDLAGPLEPCFSKTLFALIPALAERARGGGELKAEDLVFFDLETTGLSGGAGTTAFLAAFGRFTGGNYGALEIEQHLLLDYPGEPDFLRLINPMLASGNSEHPPVIVSYNGKSFDSQIIKNRCLMNGMDAPGFFCHADLLYTARCLWKRTLPSCSQLEIEKNILRIERNGDISGARAPDIWFSFLKTNDETELAGVCRHNVLDIAGLAGIFGVFSSIARDPGYYGEKYGIDFESLARRIRKYRRLYNDSSWETAETEKSLLERAARQGAPLAAFLLGKDLLRSRQYDEGLRLLAALAERMDTALAAAAGRALAIDSERRLADIERALYYTEKALSREGVSGALKKDLLRRLLRLQRPARSTTTPR